jgi:hypothetical protein
MPGLRRSRDERNRGRRSRGTCVSRIESAPMTIGRRTTADENRQF